MPKKFEQLAKRQLIKDMDDSFGDNTLFENSGINCFATAMEAAGYLETPRFVSQYEFSTFLKSPLCQKVEGKDLRPGDILSYHAMARHYQDPNKIHGYPIHASIYIANNLVFEKKGGHKDFPYQVANYDESLKITKRPVVGYRCKNKKTKQI